MRPKTIHTVARTSKGICAGQETWTALGNFANGWHGYASEDSAALASDLGKSLGTCSICAIGQPFARCNVFCADRPNQNEHELHERL